MQRNIILFLLSLLALTCQVKPTEIETEQYHLLWYRDVVERTKSLLKHPHLFRVSDIYDLYPELIPIQCGSKQCISPHIEMTNFENGAEYIKQLPTVLIVAGIHGNEVVGTNAVFRLFDIILSFKSVDETWFSILNNLRIIFLPMVNPSGFYHKRREEQQERDGSSVLIDPNRDFNWDNSDGCFVTLAGQMINHVFKDNLIIGSLTYHGGDNSLTYPWGTYVHLNHSFSKDHGAYKHIVEMLKDAAGENPKMNVPFYNTGTMEKIVYDVNGGYEDWAYGGSYEHKYLTMDCLPKHSPFSKEFLETDENSNRVFIFLVEAGMDKTPEEGTLGNQMSVLNKSDPKSIIGNISRNITLMKQFFEVMRPFPFLLEMNATPKENDQNKSILKMILDVKGCHKIDSIEITSPPVLSQSSKIEDLLYSINTQSIPIVLEAEIDRLSEKWKNPAEVHLKINCDSHWLKENVHGDPQSHFFRAKTNPDYSVTRKDFTFGAINLDDIVIHNVDINRLDKSISFHKKFDEIEILYDDHMMIKVGDRFPLELTYDVVSHQAIVSESHTRVNISNKKSKDEGITEAKDARDLNDEMDTMLKDQKGLMISIFENNSVLKVTTDSKYVLPKFRKFYENPSSFRKLKLTEDQMKGTSLDVEFKLNEPLSLSPTEYLNLLGKRVVLNVPGKVQQESLKGIIIWKKDVDSVKEAKMGKSLPLPETSNSPETKETPEKPKEENPGLKIPVAGANCGTGNPTTLVDSTNLENTFEVVLQRGKDDEVFVSAYTDQHNIPGLSFCIDDSEITALKKAKTSNSGVVRFSGKLETISTNLLGKKVQLKSGNEVVLECFLEKSEGVYSNSPVMILQDMLAQQNDFDSKAPSESYTEVKEEKPDYTRIYIIMGLFLSVSLILCLCSFCGKKIREAGQVEMREVYPEQNFNENRWQN